MSKPCKYCNQPIEMRKEAEGWRPYNPDGSKHNCRNNQPSKPENGQSSLPNPPVLAEDRVRVIVREELARFLQWIVKESEMEK